jgi:hypothetical protein
MVVDHRVASLNAVLQLAGEARANRTHTWFRGQAQPWPLPSSLGQRVQDAQA